MRLIIIQLSLFICLSNCKGQTTFGEDKLKLEKIIQMPAVKGRIDHMAINLKDKLLYLAALGNNTVEVIDLDKSSVLRSIKGIEEPQGIAYIPEQNEIAVASGGNGDCVFFNATTFGKVGTVHLAGDADNIRYDAAERKVYVGYGNGGIAVINSITHKQIGNVKLSAHPESFQLNKRNNKLYVNLPDDNSIAVVDLKSFTVIDTWKISRYRANFPMTLDTTNDIVFVGYRQPALLVSYDSKTGKQISSNELVSDVDDIFYYAGKKEIIASGGNGYINILKAQGGAGFKWMAKIPTREGARTSLLIPSLQMFILAERANDGKSAAVVVYKIND